MSHLVTARRLVVILRDRGIGDWDPAMVRRWIDEEPPCPVKRGRPGQSHKYDPEAVIAWLEDRDWRQGIEYSEEAASVAANYQADETQAGTEPVPAAAAPQPVVEPAAAPGGAGTAPSLADIQTRDPAQNTDEINRLLEVLAGRDPRNWKASEEALTTRYKRLEMMGYLVNVNELQQVLDAQLNIFLSGIQSLRGQLQMALADDLERTERATVVDQEIDTLLERVSSAASERDGDHHAA